MKHTTIRFGWPLGLLLVSFIAVAAEGADDSLQFSVPLVTPSAGPTLEPDVSVANLFTAAIRHRAGVDESVLEASGRIDLDAANGFTARFDARQYAFSDTSGAHDGGAPIPASLSAISGGLDYWHRFTDQWTVDATGGAGVYANNHLFGPGTSRETFGLGTVYRPSDQFSLTLHGFTTPYNHGALFGYTAEASWRLTDRWRLILSDGLMRSAPWGPYSYPWIKLSYAVNPTLSIYCGFMTDSAVFLVDFVPGHPAARKIGLFYEEEDLRAGLTWKIAKGWHIDLGVSAPLRQQFRYFSPFR